MTQGTAVAALCGDLTALNRRDEEEDSAVHAARGNRDRSRRQEGRKAKGPRARGGRALAPRPAEREGRTSWSEKLLRHLLHVTALSPAVLCQTERPEHTTGRGVKGGGAAGPGACGPAAATRAARLPAQRGPRGDAAPRVERDVVPARNSTARKRDRHGAHTFLSPRGRRHGRLEITLRTAFLLHFHTESQPDPLQPRSVLLHIQRTGRELRFSPREPG